MGISPDALFSGIILSCTTAASIIVSVTIAVITTHHQTKKALLDRQRLQTVNRDSALESFKAMAADLVAFHPKYNTDFSKENLLLHCKKLALIEQHLSDLSDSDLIQSYQFTKT